jgi:hypothetical protein
VIEVTDLLGYVKRNAFKWDIKTVRKVLNEVNQIQKFLENRLKEAV